MTLTWIVIVLAVAFVLVLAWMLSGVEELVKDDDERSGE